MIGLISRIGRVHASCQHGWNCCPLLMSAPAEASEFLANLRLPCSECMEIDINAVLLLSNVAFALRRELSNCRGCHTEPSCQQLQAEAFEKAIGVFHRRAPRKESFHSLADQSLASVQRPSAQRQCMCAMDPVGEAGAHEQTFRLGWIWI